MMPVQVLTVRFDADRGVMDDNPLREFQRDHFITAVREKFFTHRDTPYFAFVIEYEAVPTPVPVGVPPVPPSPRPGTPGAPWRAATASAPLLGAATSHAPARGQGGFERANDLRATLAPEQQVLFDALRDWRRKVATDEAVPPYVVLTNRQLVDLARLAPRTKAAVMKAEGLGRKRAERYADAILATVSAALVQGAPGTSCSPEPATTASCPVPAVTPVPAAAPPPAATPASAVGPVSAATGAVGWSRRPSRPSAGP